MAPLLREGRAGTRIIMMLFRYLSTSSNGPADAVMCSMGLAQEFLFLCILRLFISFLLVIWKCVLLSGCVVCIHTLPPGACMGGAVR